MIDNVESVIPVLIDLSAAFDTMNDELLLSRLSTLWTLWIVLKCFTFYLTNRTQFVDINSDRQDWSTRSTTSTSLKI